MGLIRTRAVRVHGIAVFVKPRSLPILWFFKRHGVATIHPTAFLCQLEQYVVLYELRRNWYLIYVYESNVSQHDPFFLSYYGFLDSSEISNDIVIPNFHYSIILSPAR